MLKDGDGSWVIGNGRRKLKVKNYNLKAKRRELLWVVGARFTAAWKA
jgi:hypothetical protein